MKKEDEHIRNIILGCHRELVVKKKALRASMAPEIQADAGTEQEEVNLDWQKKNCFHPTRTVFGLC